MERSTDTKTKLSVHRVSVIFVVATAAITLVFAILAFIVRTIASLNG